MGIVFIDLFCGKMEKFRIKVKKVIKLYSLIKFRFIKYNNIIISI